MSATYTESWVKDAKQNAGWLIVLGIISIVVGVLAIASPLVAGKALTIFIGVLMIINGVSQLLHTFKAGSFGAGVLGFLGGILTTFAGLLMFFRPLFGLAVLTGILAAYFLIDGISSITLGIRVRPESGWVWMIFSGALALLLGVYIFAKWPISGVWVIGTLIGIHFLFRGWALTAVGLAARGELSQAEEAVQEAAEAKTTESETTPAE
jgi:uncharacterized membrane protein HdeD (DUF308 family)